MAWVSDGTKQTFREFIAALLDFHETHKTNKNYGKAYFDRLEKICDVIFKLDSFTDPLPMISTIGSSMITVLPDEETFDDSKELFWEFIKNLRVDAAAEVARKKAAAEEAARRKAATATDSKTQDQTQVISSSEQVQPRVMSSPEKADLDLLEKIKQLKLERENQSDYVSFWVERNRDKRIKDEQVFTNPSASKKII